MVDQATADKTFFVLVNDEEQYSLWDSQNEIPDGWRKVEEGTLNECRKYVDEVWTDLRPASLRRQMNA